MKARSIVRFSNGRRLVAALLLACGVTTASNAESEWTMGGQNTDNTRTQKNESKISPATAAGLSPKWMLDTGPGGDVSATPTIEGNFVYFPTWNGKLIKADRATGNIVWERSISEYNGLPASGPFGAAGGVVRASIAISKDLLIFGDQGGRSFAGANLIAVNKNTGDLAWITQLDAHPAAFVTAAATVLDKVVYVGVASNEELLAALPIDNMGTPYPCCSFRGSMAAVNAETGAVMWKTYMAPNGFSGNAVWGSAPAIDTNRKTVYIATGNNYSAPQSFLDCVSAAGDDVDAQRACIPADNYFDAVVALDMDTGAVKWANSMIPFDVWTVGCVPFLLGLDEIVNCPEDEGPDYDFGQAPMIMKTKIGKKTIDLIGVGQKSGIFWALDPDTGAIVWQTTVDTGGLAGGLQWGSSFDGTRIYTSSANSLRLPTTLIDGSVTYSGLWSALDPITGDIIWQTANPAPFTPAGGAASSANGVVFVCSQDAEGYMYALDGATGDFLWGYPSGGSCNSGAAIADGEVYWGSGYILFGPPNTGNTLFHAFKLP